MPPMRWLSLRRVAEVLEVSTKTVQRWIAEGTFPEASMTLPNGQRRWAEVVVQGWAINRNNFPSPPPVKGK